jgi:glycerate kinase
VRIVIAPDSFKGSLSASEAVKAIQRGINNVDSGIETILVPMADGGEGTVQAMIDAAGGEIIELTVHDPLFREIRSFYGILGDGVTAVIEMAAASGLLLLSPEERNPLKTTTYGTGELIRDALDKGCLNFIIGLGGSATNDGGCGMAQALGVRLLDENGKDIGPGGGELSKISSIDISEIDRRIKFASFRAACDVENPLCGENGASAIYGRQKGAGEKDIAVLDDNLGHFANLVSQQLNVEIKNTPGAGAAGGLGAGAMVFLNAKIEKGIDMIIKATNLSDTIQGSDLVITGEGMVDFQTAFGKTPFGVAQIAKRFNIPVIAIAGSLGEDYQSLYNKGFDGLFSLTNKPMTPGEAFMNASALVEASSENIIRFWKAARQKLIQTTTMEAGNPHSM